MNLRHFSCIIFVAFLAAKTSQASEHTGYWNKRTQTGSTFECEGASTQERMVQILNEAGWNTKEGIPKIDWQRDEAVIVAPSSYYKTALLTFYGLTREGDIYILKYGWKPIPASESVGASSATFGSTEEGYPATIVIAHRRGLHNSSKFKCRSIAPG